MGARRASAMLLLLLVIQHANIASASGDGIVINLSQTSVIGDEEIGSGPVDVELNLSAVSGVNQQVNWNASLLTLEGSLIDSYDGVTTLSSGEFESNSFTLSPAPLGHSILNISLSGDLGALSSQQAHFLEVQIQRLRPMDIALGSTTQWVVDPIDASLFPTGNSTLRQGDGANVSIPVVNDGDLNWSGSISADLNGISIHESPLEIVADSTQMVSIYLQDPLLEGEHTLSVNLSGQSDSNPNDESASLIIDVGPPPLAELHLSIQRGQIASAGEDQDWNLTIDNSGEVSWTGQLSCDFSSNIVHDQEITIVSQSIVAISTTARPGVLTCHLTGPRTHSTSQMSIQDVLDIPAASFVASGISQPALSGGPWHIDDRITASLLIRNTGDEVGSVSLELALGSDSSVSEAITLGPGDATELSSSIIPTMVGDSNLVWKVISSNSEVDESLNGQIPLTVSASQSLDVEDVSFSEELEWSLSLGEGVDREVEITAGWIVGSNEYTVYESTRVMSPGTFSMNADIGQRVSADGVFVRVNAVGWSKGDGQVQASIPIDSVISEVTISLDPFTDPKPPVSEQVASVEVILLNSGDDTTNPGQVVIFDGSGTILASFETNSIDSKQELKQSVDIVWPEGSTVSLNARWFVDGEVVSTSQSYSVPIDDSSKQLELPWMSIISGLGIAAAIIFVLRLFRQGEDSDETPPSLEDKHANEQVEVSKIEISCPECDRSLRIPSTHSGKVRCPECSTAFSANQEQPVKEKTPEPENKDVQKELTSASSEDNLDCPKCSRTLRVPLDRRPAKARCPACETIFRALKE